MHSDRMLNRNARCQERSRNGAQKSEAGRTPKRGGVITRGKRNVKGPELSEVQTQNKPRTRPPDTPIERQLRSSTFFFLSNDKVGFVAWKSQLDKGYLLQSRSLWIACPIGSEECSSSESGWTTYIASSPDLEHGQVDNEDDGDDDEYGNIGHQVFKKAAKEEAADSDDSMASDASSGPSDQRYSYGYLGRSLDSGHAGSQDKKKYASKKQSQHEEKKKQRKGEKDNSRNRGNSAGRLKNI